MTWDPRIPQFIIRILMAFWQLCGVSGYVTDRVTDVRLDVEPCGDLAWGSGGCVFPHTGVVHAKWIERPWGALYWSWAMVHEAAHVQQWREGWDFASKKTEWDAEMRALRAFTRGLLN